MCGETTNHRCGGMQFSPHLKISINGHPVTVEEPKREVKVIVGMETK